MVLSSVLWQTKLLGSRMEPEEADRCLIGFVMVGKYTDCDDDEADIERNFEKFLSPSFSLFTLIMVLCSLLAPMAVEAKSIEGGMLKTRVTVI